MPRYKLKVPSGKCEIEAENKHEAIKNGMAEYIEALQVLLDSGDIFRVPDICKEIGDKEVAI